MKLLDGKQLAQTDASRDRRRGRGVFAEARQLRPGLAAVLVGDNPASQIYVKNKTQGLRKSRHG